MSPLAAQHRGQGHVTAHENKYHDVRFTLLLLVRTSVVLTLRTTVK